MNRYPSYCCQHCGACIGWIGRYASFRPEWLYDRPPSDKRMAKWSDGWSNR